MLKVELMPKSLISNIRQHEQSEDVARPVRYLWLTLMAGGRFVPLTQTASAERKAKTLSFS